MGGIVDNTTPNEWELYHLLLHEVELLIKPTPQVRNLPSSVTIGSIVDNIPNISQNFTLLCYQGWYCLTIRPLPVRTLPSYVTRGGIVDNMPTISQNFTLLCNQALYCWQYPHHQWELYPPLLQQLVLLTIPPLPVRTLPSYVNGGGIVDNIPTISQNFTFIWYQCLFCWEYPLTSENVTLLFYQGWYCWQYPLH